MADKTTLADAQQGVAKRFVDRADGTFAELVAAALYQLIAGENQNLNRLEVALRDGSAQNLNMANVDVGGSLQVGGPPNWSVVSAPAAGSQATASKAAGGGTVKHVAVMGVITWGAIAAPAATALTWVLRDGATGAGTIIAQGQLAVPAAVFQGAPIVVPFGKLVGTANTAMTLEFSAALANLLEGATLVGYDLPS